MGSLNIISISPERYIFRRTYNPSIMIPACTKGQTFTKLHVEDVTDYKVFYPEYDYTKVEKTPIPVSAQQICDDLFHAEELADKGCFIIPEDTPTPEQLAEAHARRRAYLQRLVQEGDAEMARSHRIDEIPGYMKRAAIELGADRAWAFAAPPIQMECEICGTEAKQLRSGGYPVLCRHCGNPLPGQKDRAIAEGLWHPPTEAAKESATEEKKPPRRI